MEQQQEDRSGSLCQICGSNTRKYKCPTCLLKYCSVVCFKIHREKPCTTCPQQTSVTVDNDTKESRRSRQVLFPTDDTVSPETLEKLCYSKELKELLKNPHLRYIMKEVDSHSFPKPFMEDAMREPIFTEFADICLNIAEPPPAEEKSPDSDLDT